ncbi:MAG: polysaccharide deacetylase family protein [Myxococcales bacterium]|nr:polysaccharide deacetylase family protein [Myxococcales bacterium]
MTPPATLVSVDLDDLTCYHAIHGLPPPSPEQQALCLTAWLPRFLELFDRLGVRATFFVVGRTVTLDLDGAGQGAQRLRQALREGHELGNHGHAHAYDLVHWPSERQREDLGACDAVLRELGAQPLGFRAPGYTHDARLLGHVAALGYRYDSSCLPSPPYYAAKLAAMGAMRLRGRRSVSLADGGASFFGPRVPYRRTDVELWELPMSVSPGWRWPLIGTTLLALPAPVAGMLRRSALRLPHFHLELHALDLADVDRDPISPALVRHQPELRQPWRIRYERLRELLGHRGGGVPLREAVV